jgi:uncharacterized protein
MTVHVVLCRLEFFLPGSTSLKTRRRHLSRLKERLKGHFNVSVAEVDEEEHWQTATLALAAVGKDRSYLDGLLQKALHLADTQPEMVLAHHEIEYL